MPYSHTHSRSPQPTAHSQSVREAGPNSPTHSLTHSRTHSLTPSLPPMWPHLIHSPTHTHTHTVTRSRTHALIHCSLRWFVRSIELRCFVASLLRCFVASLLRCFVASFVCCCCRCCGRGQNRAKMMDGWTRSAEAVGLTTQCEL